MNTFELKTARNHIGNNVECAYSIIHVCVQHHILAHTLLPVVQRFFFAGVTFFCGITFFCWCDFFFVGAAFFLLVRLFLLAQPFFPGANLFSIAHL